MEEDSTPEHTSRLGAATAAVAATRDNLNSHRNFWEPIATTHTHTGEDKNRGRSGYYLCKHIHNCPIK